MAKVTTCNNCDKQRVCAVKMKIMTVINNHSHVLESPYANILPAVAGSCKYYNKYPEAEIEDTLTLDEHNEKLVIERLKTATKADVANSLDISERTLYRYLKKWGING